MELKQVFPNKNKAHIIKAIDQMDINQIKSWIGKLSTLCEGQETCEEINEVWEHAINRHEAMHARATEFLNERLIADLNNLVDKASQA